AADRVGGGDRLVDEAGSERAQPMVAWLEIADGHAGAETADTPEVLRHAETRAIPDARLALIDADDSGHGVLHAGDQGFADDRNHRFVIHIPVVGGENPLFLAE